MWGCYRGSASWKGYRVMEGEEEEESPMLNCGVDLAGKKTREEGEVRGHL